MTTATSTGTPEQLRPSTLTDFRGQPDVINELRIVLGGTKARGEVVCPHLLFVGPPGLGKTTLSRIVADELKLPLISTAAPSLDKRGALAALLVSLTEPSVVFIDEIHRLPVDVQEMLYSAMEDGRIDLVVAEGTTRASSYSMDIEPFVLVGATTRAGSLDRPFRDRFGYIGRLDLYDAPTLTGIVERSARVLGTPIDSEAARLIAARSRGTPRIANQLLGRVRDLASVTGADRIDVDLADTALGAFGIDKAGLSKVDREILVALTGPFGGGPVGLTTLAAAVNEDPVTVEQSHEPFLLRSGLLRRTPRGRAATPAAYGHLGLPVPAALLLVADELELPEAVTQPVDTQERS